MNVSPANSIVSYGNKGTAKSDGSDTIVVKVRLRDHDNRPVPGRAVQLIADRVGVIITQPEPTNSEGLAIGYVTATTPGPVIISAKAFPPESSSSSASSL